MYSFTGESIHYPLIEKQTDGFRDLQRQGLAIQLIVEKNQDTSHIIYQLKNKWQKWMVLTQENWNNQHSGSCFVFKPANKHCLSKQNPSNLGHISDSLVNPKQLLWFRFSF